MLGRRGPTPEPFSFRTETKGCVCGGGGAVSLGCRAGIGGSPAGGDRRGAGRGAERHAAPRRALAMAIARALGGMHMYTCLRYY